MLECIVFFAVILHSGVKKMKKTNKKKFNIGKSLLLAVVAYFVFSAFFGVFRQIGDYNSQIEVVNKQIEEASKESKMLQEEKISMHSDENYKKIAKKTLGLVEPGDKVYINTNDK